MKYDCNIHCGFYAGTHCLYNQIIKLSKEPELVPVSRRCIHPKKDLEASVKNDSSVISMATAHS